MNEMMKIFNLSDEDRKLLDDIRIMNESNITSKIINKDLALMNQKIKCNEELMKLWDMIIDDDCKLSNNLFNDNTVSLDLSEICYRFIQINIERSSK